jgi:hypothetical protein
MPHRIESLENDEHDRCVDLFQLTDGSWGFEEFRRDPEDAGVWTQIGSYAMGIHASCEAARMAAQARIPWMRLRA